jgi:hypothetical protein
MWPRVLEFALGAWLAVSPFVFRHPAGEWRFWATDLGGSFAVVLFTLLSFWRPTERAHFLTGLVALWLVGFGYFGFERPGPPAAQNDIATGVLLLLLFFLPNETNLPPQAWREFYGERAERRP